MSEENIKNNEQLEIDNLDEASGSGMSLIEDVRYPKC